MRFRVHRRRRAMTGRFDHIPLHLLGFPVWLLPPQDAGVCKKATENPCSLSRRYQQIAQGTRIFKTNHQIDSTPSKRHTNTTRNHGKVVTTSSVQISPTILRCQFAGQGPETNRIETNWNTMRFKSPYAAQAGEPWYRKARIAASPRFCHMEPLRLKTCRFL